jgi:large subunit ribosomal protein L4
VLLVLGDGDETVWKSFRNVPHVHCLLARELNAYDVLVADHVVFTKDTVPGSAPSPDEPAAEETPVVIASEGEDSQ